MEYRIRETGEVVNYLGLFDAFPQTYVPANPAPEYLNDMGVDKVLEVVPPTVPHSDWVRDGVELVDGAWQQVWLNFPWSAERIEAERVAALPTQAQYTAALEAMYDTKAQEKRYDNRLTCALRAGYAGPFQAEGTAFAVWMDTCNATAYGIMGQVIAQEIAQPTIPELLVMMPPLTWPE